MKKYSVLPILYVAVLVIFQAVVSFMNIDSSGGLSATSAMIGTLYVAMLAIRRKSAFLIAVVFNVLTLIIGVEHQIYSELIQQPLFIEFAGEKTHYFNGGMIARRCTVRM